jgi:bifunctional oligoribonuclease and PAP phosphatase NrnA
MTTAPDFHNVRAWCQRYRRPLLLSHRRPDGDALGALAALTLALRQLGLDPRPALFDPFPRRYVFLRDLVTWRQWPAERVALEAECDAVVIVDTCAWAQLEPVADWLPHAPPTLVIDHHPTHDPLGTRPGDLYLCDVTAGALCLVLQEWMHTVGIPLSPQIATALFTGVATDCGWFRFSNTDARLLQAAGALSAAGVAPNAIYRLLYEQDPPGRLRLAGRMLESLRLLAQDRLAVMTLRGADFAAAGADATMTEDLINEAGRLECTEATILFTEESDGRVRVNLRSKSTLDVAALAAQFGGGGHVRAAGARLSVPWDDAVSQVTAAAVTALEPAAAI